MALGVKHKSHLKASTLFTNIPLRHNNYDNPISLIALFALENVCISFMSGNHTISSVKKVRQAFLFPFDRRMPLNIKKKLL